MSLRAQFKTDSKKEENGIQIEYGPNADGSVPTFTILRQGRSNRNWQKAMDRHSRPYSRQIATQQLDATIAERINRRCFAETVLIGWANVQAEDGTPMPFNIENALNLFEELPELYDDLFAQSLKVALFKEDIVEGNAKN